MFSSETILEQDVELHALGKLGFGFTGHLVSVGKAVRMSPWSRHGHTGHVKWSPTGHVLSPNIVILGLSGT